MNVVAVANILADWTMSSGTAVHVGVILQSVMRPLPLTHVSSTFNPSQIQMNVATYANSARKPSIASKQPRPIHHIIVWIRTD